MTRRRSGKISFISRRSGRLDRWTSRLHSRAVGSTWQPLCRQQPRKKTMPPSRRRRPLWLQRAAVATSNIANNYPTRVSKFDCSRGVVANSDMEEFAMVHRRTVITGSVLGGALSALTVPATAAGSETAAQQVADRLVEDIAKAVRSVRDEIERQSTFWEIAA